MALPADLDIYGVRALERKFEDLKKIPQRRGKLNKIAKNTLKPLHQRVKASAPHRTGILKRSIYLRVSKRSRIRIGAHIGISRASLEKSQKKWVNRKRKKKKVNPKYGTYGAKGFYPAVVHYGSKHVKPNPFIKRVTDAHKRHVVKRFLNRVQILIRDEVGRPKQRMLF